MTAYGAQQPVLQPPRSGKCCPLRPLTTGYPMAQSGGQRSFNHLVRAGEDRLRDSQTERMGGLEIDDQFEGRRLLDRQIGRLGTLQDPSGVNAGLTKESGEVRAIADQPAGHDETPVPRDRRNGMTRCQRYELIAPAKQEGIGGDEECVGMQLGEGRLDLAFAVGL